MPDVTITGTIKVVNSTRTPGWIYVYPRSDFYIGVTAFQSSSPHGSGDLPFKKVAVSAGAAGTGDDVGTTLYTFSIILPPTETADVNPDGARWGAFVMDSSTTPRLISEISGLESFRLPVTTPTTAMAVSLYNGGSLAPISVNVAVSGTLTVGGVATFNGAVVMNGTLNGQGIIGGAGVADRISYWTDSDTLASSPFLRIDSDTVEQRGSGGANILHVSAGYVSGVDYSRAVISATTAVVIYGVERDGSAAEIPVRLASCNGGVIQFFQDGDNQWTINQDGHFIPEGDGVRDIGTTANPVRNVSTGNIDLCSGANVQASIVSVATSVVSFPDATGLLHSRLRYGPALDLFSGTVDPEGSQTASPGSIYSRTNGSVYKKTTGAGNTGWDELAALSQGLDTTDTPTFNTSAVQVWGKLATVSFNFNIATQQTLFTCPAGKSAVITMVVFRSPSATISGRTLTVQANSSDWATLDFASVNLDTSKVICILPGTVDLAPDLTMAGTAETLDAAEILRAALNVAFGAHTGTVDVFGYLF